MKGTTLILAALLLIGCSKKADETASVKPILFTSILPQAGLVKMISGGRIEVIPLVGEGQSPHTYEPTARQLAKLGEAKALLTLGVPFEKALLGKIVPLYPELPIVETQQGIVLRAMPHAHLGENCSHGHEMNDPHVWLDPLNAIVIARNILQTLETVDPKNAETYRQNFTTLKTELETLDGEIRTQLAPYKGSRFYVFHPSFGYFADTYGLEEIPIELDGKSPSPRQLARLIEQARTDGVKVVFVQKEFPVDAAKAIAEALGGTAEPLDPLAEDIVANLRRIAESIAHALEPQ